jgi:hypothetical protein
MAPRLTARDHQLRAVTEAQWQKTVETMLRLNGWHYYHAPDNRPGKNGAVQNIRAGYPDLTAIRGTRTLGIELKRETGKTTPEQDEWLAVMAGAGWETYVWRPSDAPTLQAVLAPGWTT